MFVRRMCEATFVWRIIKGIPLAIFFVQGTRVWFTVKQKIKSSKWFYFYSWHNKNKISHRMPLVWRFYFYIFSQHTSRLLEEENFKLHFPVFNEIIFSLSSCGAFHKFSLEMLSDIFNCNNFERYSLNSFFLKILIKIFTTPFFPLSNMLW